MEVPEDRKPFPKTYPAINRYLVRGTCYIRTGATYYRAFNLGERRDVPYYKIMLCWVFVSNSNRIGNSGLIIINS